MVMQLHVETFWFFLLGLSIVSLTSSLESRNKIVQTVSLAVPKYALKRKRTSENLSCFSPKRPYCVVQTQNALSLSPMLCPTSL